MAKNTPFATIQKGGGGGGGVAQVQMILLDTNPNCYCEPIFVNSTWNMGLSKVRLSYSFARQRPYSEAKHCNMVRS